MTVEKEYSPKFPDEVRHLGFNWAPKLAEGDSVVADSVQAVPVGSEGLSVEIIDTIGAATRITLSGGAAPSDARIQFSAGTESGEVLGENVLISIKPR